MESLRYAVWGAALLFTAAGLATLFLRSHTHLGGDYVAAWLLLAALAVAATTNRGVYHLLWLFPLALAVPALIMNYRFNQTYRYPRFNEVLVKSCLVYVPALAIVFTFA